MPVFSDDIDIFQSHINSTYRERINKQTMYINMLLALIEKIDDEKLKQEITDVINKLTLLLNT